MAVYLLTYGGVLGIGDEVFQHTIAIDNPSILSEGEEEVAERGADAFEAAFAVTGFAGCFPAGVVWEYCKAAEVLNLSTGALSAAHTHAMDLEATGSGSTGHAAQVALAVSLKAGNRPNGTPIRGRFYLPRPGATAAPNGFLTTTAQGQIGAAMRELLDELDTFTPALTPVVWSRTLGNTTNITELRIGRVVDTIRSRRAQLAEQYGSAF